MFSDVVLLELMYTNIYFIGAFYNFDSFSTLSLVILTMNTELHHLFIIGNTSTLYL